MTRSLLCRTIIGRAVCERGAIREGNQAFGRMNSDIIGLYKGNTGKDLHIHVCPLVKESLVSPMTFIGDDPSA